MHQSFEPPHPGYARGKAGTITSIHQLVNTSFHFFIVWFSDGSKSSRERGERTSSSRLKIRQTSLRMSGGFTFNLSVVAILRRLVIWTFDISYLCSSHSHFLLLKMLLKVWWEDSRKAVTADSTQGTLVYTAEYQGAGTSLNVFAPVSGNFTGFHTHTG